MSPHLRFACRLTKNPRVDFISKRVEDIKGKKADVTKLATASIAQINGAKDSVAALNEAMLDAYKAELGDRKWDEPTSSYTRVLHPEEKRLVADMERALARSMQTLTKVLDTYTAHLQDVADRPLTFNTPEEESRLETVMQTKEEYKDVRTAYSDAMIDADAHLSTGADPSPNLQQRVDEAKRTYEDMSERLCDDALKYEHIYREELSQRIAAHFTAEQRFVRGVESAMRDFYPYTNGLTLDWQQMRAARKSALANKPRAELPYDSSLDESLPPAETSSPSSSARTGASSTASKSANGPLDGVVDSASKAASAAQSAASTAASSVGSAARSASKGISDALSSYAPAARTAKSAASARSAVSGDDGWANIKL